MKKVLLLLIMVLLYTTVNGAEKASLKLQSSYKECINLKSTTKNLVTDFNVQPNSEKDITSQLQNALNSLGKDGGGNLIIPKGTYHFSDVCMVSNVHILVDKNAILKPYWGAKSKSCVLFHFSPESKNETPEYVENCSIRGLNGKYTVDYSAFKHGQGLRFIVARMAKNFLIADANIKDNFTKFCGIIFVPSKETGADKWPLSRPTNGEIRDCSISNADSGYGLCQLHGAQSLYFENIYANGGVTLRLESGAGGRYAGVFDIQAKNISQKGGRAGVMMNPHCTHNGTVKIDGVHTECASAAVLVHGGFIDKKHKDDPNATIGTYANDCEIVNIHAIYGESAQVDDKEVWILPPSKELYAKFHHNAHGNPKSLQGPSYGVVFNSTENEYNVSCKNITFEGFPYYVKPIIYNTDIKDREKNKWNILKQLPCMASKQTTTTRKPKGKGEF